MEFLKQQLAAMKPRHFPAVGWLAGVAACASFALLALVLHGNLHTPLVAAVGCTMATALLTGASHEQALADTFGKEGSIVLVLALAMKVSLLAVLAGQSEAGVLIALFAAQTVSRFATLVYRVPNRELAIAGAWCVPPLLLAMFARGVAFAVWSLLFTALTWWLMRMRFAPRDVSAATQPVCEIAFYLGAAIAFG